MADNQNPLSSCIQRTAIDPFGHLGSLYDACQDRVLQQLEFPFDKPPNQFPYTTQCTLAKGHKNQKQNPLEIIGIDEQLQFSLALNIIPKNGITSAMNYPHVIDQYTRVFHFTYVYRVETLPNDLQLLRSWLETMKPGKNATHVIAGITWGIDIVIFIQLPPDDNVTPLIDDTLEKYRAYLNGDSDHFQLTREDVLAYKKLTDTKIYSNMSVLSENSTLHDVFHSITRRKMNHNEHQQINYILCALQPFFSSLPLSDYHYVSLDVSHESKLEEYLFDLSRSLKHLESYFNEDMSSLLCGHFKERLTNAYKQWYDLKNEANSIVDRLGSLVCDMRSGSVAYFPLDEAFETEQQIQLKTNIQNLTQNVADLNAKGHLISDLGHQEFQYCDVVERHVDENDNEESLRGKLIIDQNSDRVLCSSDQLNQNNPQQLKELRYTLVEELERNSKLRLTYADFSYCNFELPNMIILPFSKYHIRQRIKPIDPLVNSDFNSSVSSMSTTAVSMPLVPSILTNKSINILLLGETAAGKSMFINAFANYITFNTFEKIHSEEPLIPIPVSFFIPVGDNYEERLVKYDDVKNIQNENFDHPGQSVTQQCKSYVFHPNFADKSKLRIIDTPGFGDVRGAEHDNRTMEHIFDYVKKLAHINAICIFLRSGRTELNGFLSECLQQLYEYFGSHVRRNLIFCFTHTRTTAYTSGSAGVLLQDILASLPMRKVPLKKKNTFCFDNETFRYFVALQNQFQFSDQNREDYEKSWTKSVMEANRLVRYIRKNLVPIPVPDQWETIKRTQIEIVQLIHPLLETMRYILRNIISRKISSMKVSNQLNEEDTFIDGRDKDKYDDQYLPYEPIPLEFLQNYEISNCSMMKKQKEMINHLSFLYDTSAELGYFLAYSTTYPNGNPFLAGLFRLMTEEKNMCDDYGRSYMDMQLVESLKALSTNYEQCMKIFKVNGKRSKLSDIQQRIRFMYTYPLLSDYVIDSHRISNGTN
ncbi:unnamed protein product [Adineta ricciae]|nr:unnamed protein product [Adineta ricciae]